MAISARFWLIRPTSNSHKATYPKQVTAFTIQGFVSTDATGTDLFQGKTAYATSAFSATYAAGKAVDGNDTTRWTSEAFPSGYQSWWVDLGAVYAISSIKVLAYYDTALYFPATFSLDYGSDGTNWTELVAGISSANATGWQTYGDLQAGGGPVVIPRLGWGLAGNISPIG